MEITKREIILSIAIIAILLVLGFSISDRIASSENEKFAEYQKALHIDNTELFQHCMDTNSGNAFVYGELIAVDPVTYEEIGGEYAYVKKVREEYRMHTRTVTKTKTVNGKTKTYTEVETYWTWDEIDRESKRCSTINFCGVDFNSGKFNLPYENYITTIKQSSHVRYKYYGVNTKYIGTIYSELKDGDIAKHVNFYNNMTPEGTLENVTQSSIPLFWGVWIVLIIGCVIGFYYLENRWLEN